MTGRWIEVWGVERDSADSVLLYKVPLNQWNPDMEQQYVDLLKRLGVRDHQFRQVDEGSDPAIIAGG